MQEDPNIRAFSIAELLKLAPIGRSTLYNAIKAGRLRTRKPFGRRTIVLKSDWEAFLAGSDAAASVAVPTGRRPRGRPRKVPLAPPTAERVPLPADTIETAATPAPAAPKNETSKIEPDRALKISSKNTKPGIAQ
jgi:hypothetical protein